MRFEIFHEIEYRYSTPVFFEPQLLFFRPREDKTQRLLGFELKIDPRPVLDAWEMDDFGNHPFRAWFRELSERFRIEAHSEVEVTRTNPFDFVLDDDCLYLPVKYRRGIKEALTPYLPAKKVHPAVSSFSHLIADRVGLATLPFLAELCREIAYEFKRVYRADVLAHPAHEVLETRSGTCRDLTVLFMECCRTHGLAARFTSGYFEGDMDPSEREMHSWSEVYLEGGGWRGYDPAAGIPVSESHVPIAAAALPATISPVIGTYSGNSAVPTVKSSLRIRRKS